MKKHGGEVTTEHGFLIRTTINSIISRPVITLFGRVDFQVILRVVVTKIEIGLNEYPLSNATAVQWILYHAYIRVWNQNQSTISCRNKQRTTINLIYKKYPQKKNARVRN